MATLFIRLSLAVSVVNAKWQFQKRALRETRYEFVELEAQSNSHSRIRRRKCCHGNHLSHHLPRRDNYKQRANDLQSQRPATTTMAEKCLGADEVTLIHSLNFR